MALAKPYAHTYAQALSYIYTLYTRSYKHANIFLSFPISWKLDLKDASPKDAITKAQMRSFLNALFSRWSRGCEPSSSTAGLTDTQTEMRRPDKAERSHLMRQRRTQRFPLLELQTPNNAHTRIHTNITCCSCSTLPASQPLDVCVCVCVWMACSCLDSGGGVGVGRAPL